MYQFYQKGAGDVTTYITIVIHDMNAGIEEGEVSFSS